MEKTRSSSLAVCLVVVMAFGLSLIPALPAAAATRTVVGDWEGTLDPGAQPKKRIIVHISAGQDGNLSGTIDYPDQEASGILITAITYKESALHFESSSAQVSYDGASNQDNSEIAGTWKQAGAGVSLTLKRTR
jgi:hypothetical protein